MPSLAYSRKQILQSPKSRIKPRLRPQRKQRRTILDENFGFLSARALVEVFATIMMINADNSAIYADKKEIDADYILVYPRTLSPCLQCRKYYLNEG